MEFDYQNFGIGYVAGLATAYAIYRSRHMLASARDAALNRAQTAQTEATRSADSRYVRDLLKQAESSHLFGERVKLTDIIVEPRFIPAPPIPEPQDEEDVVHDVFSIVPFPPDFPYLAESYNLETLSVEDLGRGDHTLALLGLPGSGRTTALLAIALWGLGIVDFTPPPDVIQQELDEEEAKLSAQERAERIKERMYLATRAQEQMSEDQGEGAQERQTPPSRFKFLAPLYIHLGNLHLASGEFSRQVDPAEPLVRALQYQVSRITAKTMPRTIYKRLNEGRALVLLDGYDELSDEEKPLVRAWLKAFLEVYEQNFIIITGSANGYGDLTRLGFTPVFLRPWDSNTRHKYIENIVEHWAEIIDKRRATLAPITIEQAHVATHALLPAELALRTLYLLSEGETDLPAMWVEKYLTDLVKNPPWGILSEAAAIQIEQGYFTIDDLINSTSPITTQEVQAISSDVTAEFEQVVETAGDDGTEFDKLMQLFEGGAEETADANATETPEAAPEAAPTETKAEQRAKKSAQKVLQILEKARIITQLRGGRYRFKHPIVADYLASRLIRTLRAEDLEAVALMPKWSSVIAFAAGQDIEPALQARLNAAKDILYHHIFEVARWVAYAPAETPWRDTVLKRLDTILNADNVFPSIRERAAAALIATRAPEAVNIFARAMRSSSPIVRQMACLGLGALGNEDSLHILENALGDEEENVQVAAVLGLGALRTDAALEAIAHALMTGSDLVRQAAAETFAAIPDEGYRVLYDAVSHEQMFIRRAAIFGLKRVRTPWALLALYRASLEDPQWYVQSAAQQAFQDINNNILEGVKAYPRIEAIGWLRRWAMERIDDLPEDITGRELLQRALEDPNPEIQALSTMTIGQLGIIEHTAHLYELFRMQDEALQLTAYEALGKLQLHLGQTLPAPF